MDNSNVPVIVQANESIFNNKNIVIILLGGLLLFSLLGINIIEIVSNIITYFLNIVKPFLIRVLSLFGYTAGTVINTTTDLASLTAKTGIDIASGALHSVGDLLKNPSEFHINASGYKIPSVSADTTKNPIQNPIASSKTNWCLVGEYEGRRGCINVNDQSTCMSGQVFPTQQLCLNPTMTNNMQHPLKGVRG